jgi:Uma2 family endonuclease
MQTHSETVPYVAPQTPPPEPEQRVLLHGINWETYERLLADLADRSAPRLTFDRGVLEIMSPTAEHEEHNRTLALLVEVVTEELHINIRRLGSTTFKRQDLLKGFEPDSCFYIQSAQRIRGKKRIDLTQDPPPDLVIEIDWTSSSLDRFPIFAHVGVAEVWRYDSSCVRIFRLAGEQYEEVAQSVALPLLTSAVVTQFLADSTELESTVWLRHLREWVRKQAKKTHHHADR